MMRRLLLKHNLFLTVCPIQTYLNFVTIGNFLQKLEPISKKKKKYKERDRDIIIPITDHRETYNGNTTRMRHLQKKIIMKMRAFVEKLFVDMH